MLASAVFSSHVYYIYICNKFDLHIHIDIHVGVKGKQASSTIDIFSPNPMPPINGCGIMELAVSFYACYCEVCGYVKHLNNSANGSTIDNGANGFRLVYFCFKCLNKVETANRVLYH